MCILTPSLLSKFIHVTPTTILANGLVKVSIVNQACKQFNPRCIILQHTKNILVELDFDQLNHL